MEAVEVIADLLELNAGLIKMALEGLSDADLSTQPNDQSNPVGWLVWHQTRVEDVTISGLTQSAQVWGEGGWKAKFGVDVEDEDTGVGHSLEKVASMAFTKENLLGYAGAVRGKTLSALKGFTPADLDKEVPYPGGGGKHQGRHPARPVFHRPLPAQRPGLLPSRLPHGLRLVPDVGERLCPAHPNPSTPLSSPSPTRPAGPSCPGWRAGRPR